MDALLAHRHVIKQIYEAGQIFVWFDRRDGQVAIFHLCIQRRWLNRASGLGDGLLIRRSIRWSEFAGAQPVALSFAFGSCRLC